MTKKRILVVDNEATITSRLKMNLEATGAYEVKEENRGNHALATAREFRPDLILLDLVMPNTTGEQVASDIQADPELGQTPIVFLTAAVTEDGASVRVHSALGRRILPKPVDISEVIHCIQTQLKT